MKLAVTWWPEADKALLQRVLELEVPASKYPLPGKSEDETQRSNCYQDKTVEQTGDSSKLRVYEEDERDKTSAYENRDERNHDFEWES